MEARAQSAHTGALGLTDFERFLAVICWWMPLVALISIFFGSAPRSLRRHALWSVLTVIAVPFVAVVFGALFGGLGFLIAGGEGAGAGILIGVLAFAGAFQGVAALPNTLAVLVNRGPYFMSAGTGRRL